MTHRDIVNLLQTPDAQALFTQADAVRKQHMSDAVHIRGILEFSNYCAQTCAFCGISAANTHVTRYRLSKNEIIAAAHDAVTMGYKTLVLQSGEDAAYSTADICDIIQTLKSKLDIALTLSIGEKTKEEYAQLKKAGADRYLLRFETSNEKLFALLKPGSTLKHRLQCLQWLKETGFQTGSGVMIGLPGQTIEDLANDTALFAKLDLDMIGVGPFLAHPDTALANTPNPTMDLVLRFVAVTRIVNPHSHIPATTAMGTLDPQGRQKALQCGANVFMPNVTPKQYRKHYQLYPSKICVDETPSDCRACVQSMIESIGRTVGQGYGDSLKK